MLGTSIVTSTLPFSPAESKRVGGVTFMQPHDGRNPSTYTLWLDRFTMGTLHSAGCAAEICPKSRAVTSANRLPCS